MNRRYTKKRHIGHLFIAKRRIHEKGAALVTVVILLGLMLVICGALILITTLSTTSTVDLVAEKQALQAAEAGMQRVISILRGNGSGEPISFRKAALRSLSNKGDDWMPQPRLSNWLNYDFPLGQPDRVTLSPGYTPYNGLAFSVSILAPDAAVKVIPTPNPTWIDGPVIKPDPPVKPPKPAWHPWNCSHCSWDYTHCSLYNPPNDGTLRKDGNGCRHKHCIPPPNWGGGIDDGYQRLIVKVTGYGPRGARKELEMLVKRTMLTYDHEPLIYIQGATSGFPVTFNITGTPEIEFKSGSNLAFTTTNIADVTAISDVMDLDDKVKTDSKGDIYETLNVDEIPQWLVSVSETRNVTSYLEEDAKIRSRWFDSYPAGNAGTDSSPEFTFIRGDAVIKDGDGLNYDGAGLLVVTGKLTVDKDFKYKGLIMLLGDGRLDVTGGDSKIEGAVLLAKFGLFDYFSPASLNFSGGKLEFKYESQRVEAARKLINMQVIAVREF